MPLLLLKQYKSILLQPFSMVFLKFDWVYNSLKTKAYIVFIILCLGKEYKPLRLLNKEKEKMTYIKLSKAIKNSTEVAGFIKTPSLNAILIRGNLKNRPSATKRENQKKPR